MIHQKIQPDFKSWRDAARKLLVRNVQPQNVMWEDATDDQPLLTDFATDSASPSDSKEKLARVPKEFIKLAQTVSMHRDSDRWALLYRILYRLTHGEHELLEIAVDDDVHRLMTMDKAVHRDMHKMTAFVRFRRVVDDMGEHFIAWHRPDHHIVKAMAPWFAQRFAIMRWTILTPEASASWDTKELTFGEGVPASEAPQGDVLEDLWRTYYAAIFNPARVKVKAMKKELPVRHWPTLPEAKIIDELLHEAPTEVTDMMRKSKKQSIEVAAKQTTGSAISFIPPKLELPVLKKAATECKGCDLYCNATQVVFGEGPDTASVMFIGEQPGDQEDLAGKPFIGPSGQLLDRALEEVGIDRSEVYVTNAVKHFKFEPRGKRRIHSTPNAREMSACRPWLEAEIATVRPKLIVCLGATAAKSLMGPQFRITKDRGQIFSDTDWAPALVATNHPSAILRAPDPAAREESYRHFIHDLEIVHKQMEKISRADADKHGKKMEVALLSSSS